MRTLTLLLWCSTGRMAVFSSAGLWWMLFLNLHCMESSHSKYIWLTLWNLLCPVNIVRYWEGWGWLRVSLADLCGAFDSKAHSAMVSWLTLCHSMTAKTIKAKTSFLYDGMSSCRIPYHCTFKRIVFLLTAGTSLFSWRAFSIRLWWGVLVWTHRKWTSGKLGKIQIALTHFEYLYFCEDSITELIQCPLFVTMIASKAFL